MGSFEDEDEHNREIRRRYYGGDDECNHEDDGEGTCLGCGKPLGSQSDAKDKQ